MTPDVHGACTSGASPFVINTYDTDPGGVSWGSPNYAVGDLTQSYSINYFPGPDFAQGKVTENFQYDQRGRQINQRLFITATGGTLAFPTIPRYQENISYNDANQPMTTQTTVGGNAGYTFSQSYDSTTGVLNGLSNTSTGTQSLVALSYNTRGLLASMLLNSTTGSSLAQVAYTYDANLRPTNATATWQSGSGQSGTIFAQGTSYDAASNILSQITQQAAVPGQSNSGGTETQNFCYNEQNQLTWAGNSGTVPAAGNGTCGNQTFQSTLGGNYANSYVYTHLGQAWQAPLNGNGTQEQYLYCNSAQPHQVTALSSVSSSPTCSSAGNPDYMASYDKWGNIITRTASGTTGTLSYDGLDRLVRWNAGTSNEEWYMYDGAGNRVLRRFINTSGTSIITYPFGLEEHTYTSSGTDQGDNYYYTVAGRTFGQLSVVGSARTTSIFLTDSLGTIVSSFTNVGGSAVLNGNQAYGPYGNKRYSSGTVGTSKGFTGQYSDSNSGLDYYNARYYDPGVGRFVSADTVQGNVQGMDPYEYVGGNPETRTDPTGHCWVFGCIVLAGVIIGAVVGAVHATVTDLMGPNHTLNARDIIGGAVTGAISGGALAVVAIPLGISTLIGSALTMTIKSTTSVFTVALASLATGLLTSFLTEGSAALYNLITDHWFGPEINLYTQGYNQGVKDTGATATAEATKPTPTSTPDRPSHTYHPYVPSQPDPSVPSAYQNAVTVDNGNTIYYYQASASSDGSARYGYENSNTPGEPTIYYATRYGKILGD